MSIEETEWITEINKCMDKKEKWYLQRIKNLEKQNLKLVQKMHMLEKKLAIATKALKEYADQDKWSYCSEDIDYFYSTKPGYRDAEKALKEMEGVK